MRVDARLTRMYRRSHETMLRAFLAGKIRVTSDAKWSEDMLTAAVFERITYLPPPSQERVLREGVVRLSGSPFPALLGVPRWHFWPSWRPGADDRAHDHRVEPDLVARWSNVDIIVESKHRGAQSSAQWRAELLASMQHIDAAPSRIFIALGGAGDVARAQRIAAGLAGSFPEVLFFSLPWDRLAQSLDALRADAAKGGEHHVDSMLRDALRALKEAGHFRSVLATLPRDVPRSPFGSVPKALASWRFAR